MTKSEAIDILAARDRIKAALDMFLSQLSGEIEARHVQSSVGLLVKGHADDMMADIDHCLDIDDLRELVSEPAPRGIPS